MSPEPGPVKKTMSDYVIIAVALIAWPIPMVVCLIMTLVTGNGAWALMGVMLLFVWAIPFVILCLVVALVFGWLSKQ